jgi:DNA repair ATPase RecN
LSTKSNTFLSLYDRINSIYIDLDDVLSDLEKHNDNLTNNPRKLSEISDLLSSVNNVLKKTLGRQY